MGEIISELRQVRAQTEKLCEPLMVEDFGVQSMPDVSPPKWHLAHTSWFFEEFLLSKNLQHYEPYHPAFRFLFNSYYESVGAHLERPRRGLISRPTVEDIFQYRASVDQFLDRVEENSTTIPILETGLHHEQQHQELILTDIKHNFWSNPLHPTYLAKSARLKGATVRGNEATADWLKVEEGLYEIGHDGEQGFSFDIERPRHPVYLADFEIQTRLITNQEYLEFIRAGGYENPAYWLSQGWEVARINQWTAPLYWIDREREMTLSGVHGLDPESPVIHVSYFEADAFARWRGARLPTEAEWETASARFPVCGSFLESENFHPSSSSGSLPQFWGEAWQWTSSAYRPYPGFKPHPGAFVEYNGKFMSNQMILRGGSCVTPRSHIRATYRNYFPPEARWQFSGIRLAR
jgi:ergothioneine biosynthesis protein EgtB